MPYRSELPRLLLFLALVCAPWAGAERTGVAFQLTRVGIALALVGWAVHCVQDSRMPRVPRMLGAAAGALALQALWMTLNGATVSLGVHALVQALPGSVNRADSMSQLPDLLLLLGVIAFTADESRHHHGRRRLWLALVWSALFWVAAGLGEKIQQGAWQPNGSGRAPFSTFLYHANAGAYINLVWPLGAGLFLASLVHETSPWLRLMAGLATAVPLAATFVNVSRACTFLAGVMILVLLLAVVREAWRGGFPGMRLRNWGVLGLLLTLLVGSMIWAGGADRMTYRWQRFRGELVPDHHRLVATKAWLSAVPESGWLGFGPNTFTNVARRFAGDAGDGLISTWPYAHQDQLQTVMEWGWLGTASWCVVFVGAIAVSMLAGRKERLRSSDRWLRFSAILALGGVWAHGLVDYPFQVFPIQLFIACMLGILWGFQRGADHSGA